MYVLRNLHLPENRSNGLVKMLKTKVFKRTINFFQELYMFWDIPKFSFPVPSVKQGFP